MQHSSQGIVFYLIPYLEIPECNKLKLTNSSLFCILIIGQLRSKNGITISTTPQKLVSMPAILETKLAVIKIIMIITVGVLEVSGNGSFCSHF